MNDTQINELTLLTALECLMASTQVEGNKVGHFDELTEAMDTDHLSVEGLDLVVAIKQLRKWISDFIIKISFYIQKTVAKMTSANLDDQTAKTLQARFNGLKYLEDLPHSLQRRIKNNIAMFVVWKLGTNVKLSNLLGADSGSVTPDELDKALSGAGLQHAKISVKGDDIVNAITIRSAVGNKLSVAYFTDKGKFGTVEIDCENSRNLALMPELLQDFLIMNKSLVEGAYKHLEKSAKEMSKALTDDVDKNMSDATIKRIRAKLGFKLSVVVKQIALVKNMNEFLIATARMIGE